MRLEHKTVRAELKMDDGGSGEARIATLNVVDKDGDVTLPGFFGDAQVAHLLPAHDWSHVPMGKGRVVERGDAAYVAFQINTEIAAARDWQSALKFDLANPPAIQEWSYGFRVHADAWKEEQRDGRRVRLMGPRPDGSPGAIVHEFSPVVVGAGEGTGTVAVKGRGARYVEELDAAVEALRSIVARTKAVRGLRREKGGDLAPDRLKAIREIAEELPGLGLELGELLTDVARTDPANLFADFIRVTGKARAALSS